jgi:DNA polymerase-1
VCSSDLGKVQSCVLDFCHDGRLHAEVNQYKSDDGGTITYRFAYSNPPLQQSPRPEPKLSPDYGTDFRSCFVADGVWGCNDYSQQEYRLIAHFADVCGVRGGREAVEAYRDNPDMDIHQYVADLMGLSRSEGKIQNFAIVYGEGIATTAAKYGVTVEEMKEKREILTSKAPFGPALDEYCKNVAQKRGYLRLIDGARVRFPEWEAAWVSPEEYSRGISEKWRMEPCSKEEAEKRRHDERHPWHGCKLRRAGVRKSLNKLIQGSAARQTKMAMRECRRVGLITLLQMHDELNHDEDSEKKIQQVAEIMRTVVPLRLPVKVDTGCGANWAEAKSKG